MGIPLVFSQTVKEQFNLIATTLIVHQLDFKSMVGFGEQVKFRIQEKNYSFISKSLKEVHAVKTLIMQVDISIYFPSFENFFLFKNNKGMVAIGVVPDGNGGCHSASLQRTQFSACGASTTPDAFDWTSVKLINQNPCIVSVQTGNVPVSVNSQEAGKVSLGCCSPQTCHSAPPGQTVNTQNCR